MKKIHTIMLLMLSGCSSFSGKDIRQVESPKALREVGQYWMNSIGLDFAFIPPGQFEMGSEVSEYEIPIHKRTIQKFAMSTTEVSIGQFRQFLNETGRMDSTLVLLWEGFPLVRDGSSWEVRAGNDSQEPIVWVTCLGAKAFCDWLSKKEGCLFRLPSEAEWEYACRAGTKTHFYFGDKISSHAANFNGHLISDFGIRSEFRGRPLPVKSFDPNKWGLYDMHGNVWEYCEDSWHDSFWGAPDDSRAWLQKPDNLSCVIKGGSWYSDDKEVRSAVRFGELISEANAAWGFRVAMDLPQE